ncbi:MAG: TonB family protein [Proteobacteria bacterium]|nr:TonB family protein [Pseudomonadota bacterium]
MKLLIFILCFTSTLASADLIDAHENYANKNYSAAFIEFMTLAKLGNTESQYNIAVMLTKGEGVAIDLIQAYAWSKIVSHIEKYQALNNIIEQDLSPQDLEKAQELYKIYFDDYAYENSKVILGPISELDAEGNEILSRLSPIPYHRAAPKYPMEMVRQGVQGWVGLLFYVYPDGSIRDIQIVEEIPVGAFGKAAIQAIEQYRFKYTKDGVSTPLEEPMAFSQKIIFKLKNNEFKLSNRYKLHLSKLLEKAEKGDIGSQYKYAAIRDRLSLDSVFFDQEVAGEKINQWLFTAAQHGIPDAQYRIGKNIYYGKACKIQKQKGLDWIMRAAQAGNSDAQYMAFKMLKNESIINQSKYNPFYWLEQAAKNGLTIAQLLYAKEISKQPSPSKEELDVAKKYITNYAKHTFKTIQWYQISALIDDKLNKHSGALSKIKKAVKLAKKYEWDITELEQQKAIIAANKKARA